MAYGRRSLTPLLHPIIPCALGARAVQMPPN